MTKILELYGVSTRAVANVDWKTVVAGEFCPYLQRKCLKVRKSRPEDTIGTCTTLYGKEQKDVIICPYRLLERRQIFVDCLHLLTLHEPGNELHIVPEIGIPGGNVDYFLVSVRNKEIKNFVGIELQTLDTTGTIWPERQRFIHEQGIQIEARDLAVDSDKSFGMNWKMTAKTILVQLYGVPLCQDTKCGFTKSYFSFTLICSQAHSTEGWSKRYTCSYELLNKPGKGSSFHPARPIKKARTSLVQFLRTTDDEKVALRAPQ